MISPLSSVSSLSQRGRASSRERSFSNSNSNSNSGSGSGSGNGSSSSNNLAKMSISDFNSVVLPSGAAAQSAGGGLSRVPSLPSTKARTLSVPHSGSGGSTGGSAGGSAGAGEGSAGRGRSSRAQSGDVLGIGATRRHLWAALRAARLVGARSPRTQRKPGSGSGSGLGSGGSGPGRASGGEYGPLINPADNDLSSL